MKSIQFTLTTALLSCAMMVLPITPCAASEHDEGNASSNASDFAKSHANSSNFTRSWESYNKDVVIQLSKSMLGEARIEEVGEFFARDLIQHDPKLQDGRQAMQDWILSLRQLTPANTLSIKHVLADRDMVFVHSHLSPTPSNEFSGLNRYDMYRLDRGIIVEHWALQAKAPVESESGNSAFSDLYVYATPPAPLSEQRVEMNRLMAQTLSEEVFGLRNFGLLDRLWATNYIQHNPYVGNGRAALAEVIEYIAPVGSRYRVVRSMADGDLTLVCSQNTKASADPANEFIGLAVCDIYRVVNFELVEHWDISQRVAATSVNGHSMFSNLYRKHH